MVRSLPLAAALAFLWALLTGGSAASWALGLPFIALAVGLAVRLRAGPAFALRPAAAAAFLPVFLLLSLRGGWDVAIRAFRPSLPLAPGRITYPCRLPAGPPRLLFGNVLSLLPGTLFLADREGDLDIHVLDRNAPLTRDLAALEARVARLFGIALENPQ
ncbi:MAG: Na+/H+ antiporter subunit E [Thiohalorhabdus sp.]|uniref:Na+/H+ antiporter subunit E n=1 Tax=Thiohalorhabdus sp. TaxID=3094134 RepID=UPI00398031C7